MLNLKITVKWGAKTSITDTTLTDYPPAGLPKYGFIGIQIKRSPTIEDNFASLRRCGHNTLGGRRNHTGSLHPGHRNPNDNTRQVPDNNIPTYRYLSRNQWLRLPGEATRQLPCQGRSRQDANYPFRKKRNYCIPDSVRCNSASHRFSGRGDDHQIPLRRGSFRRRLLPRHHRRRRGDHVLDQRSALRGDGSGAIGHVSRRFDGNEPTVSVLSSRHGHLRSRAEDIARIPDRVHDLHDHTVRRRRVRAGHSRRRGYPQPDGRGSDWSAATPPAGVNNLLQVTCPSTTGCVAIGSGTRRRHLVGHHLCRFDELVTRHASRLASRRSPRSRARARRPAWPSDGVRAAPSSCPGTSTTGTWTWTPDTLPAGTSSLSQITCASTTACLIVGTGASGADLLSGTPRRELGHGSPTHFPSRQHLVADPDHLPSATTCLAIGSGAGNALVLSGRSDIG